MESETTKNNKILKEVVNDRCQQILKRKCKMRHELVVKVLGQKLIFRNEICSNITYWKLPVDCCINCTSNSNINSNKNKTNVCSSSFHGRTNDLVQMQICLIYKCFEEELSANVWACQQQSNGVDCGVLKIATVFHLLLVVNVRKENLRR